MKRTKYGEKMSYGATLILTEVTIIEFINSIELTDGVAIWRRIVRDGVFALDKAITPLGFDGVENTDWINVREA
jgi:hypothetical protein